MLERDYLLSDRWDNVNLLISGVNHAQIRKASDIPGLRLIEYINPFACVPIYTIPALETTEVSVQRGPC